MTVTVENAVTGQFKFAVRAIDTQNREGHVFFETVGGGSCAASCTVDSIAPTAAPSDQSDTSNQASGDDKTDSTVMLIGIIAGVVVLLVIVGLVILMRRNKGDFV